MQRSWAVLQMRCTLCNIFIKHFEQFWSCMKNWLEGMRQEHPERAWSLSGIGSGWLRAGESSRTFFRRSFPLFPLILQWICLQMLPIWDGGHIQIFPTPSDVCPMGRKVGILTDWSCRLCLSHSWLQDTSTLEGRAVCLGVWSQTTPQWLFTSTRRGMLTLLPSVWEEFGWRWTGSGVGTFVLLDCGCPCWRCLMTDVVVAGNLALSRALGDFVFKKNEKKRPEEQIVTGKAVFVVVVLLLLFTSIYVHKNLYSNCQQWQHN